MKFKTYIDSKSGLNLLMVFIGINRFSFLHLVIKSEFCVSVKIRLNKIIGRDNTYTLAYEILNSKINIYCLHKWGSFGKKNSIAKKNSILATNKTYKSKNFDFLQKLIVLT